MEPWLIGTRVCALLIRIITFLTLWLDYECQVLFFNLVKHQLKIDSIIITTTYHHHNHQHHHHHHLLYQFARTATTKHHRQQKFTVSVLETWSPKPRCWQGSFLLFFFLGCLFTLFVCLFVCFDHAVQHVGSLVAACAQDLVPQPGIEPWATCIGSVEIGRAHV